MALIPSTHNLSSPRAARSERPAIPVSPVLAWRLQGTLDAQRAQSGALGAAVTADGPAGVKWVGSSGAADLTGTPLHRNDRLRIYSVTKTFTAALILKLVDEGHLKLRDPLSRWFPNFPNATKITVEQLLSHQSGLTDYITHPRFWGPERKRRWTPDEILDLAATLAPKAAPRSALDYCNTNFVLLGRIAEKVTGKPYEKILRQKVLSPAGLKDTYLYGYEKGAPFVRGTRYAPNGMMYDATADDHPSISWSAGALVSTTEDLVRFAKSIFEGQLLSKKSVEEMTRMRKPATAPDGSIAGAGLGLVVKQTAVGPLYYHEGGGDLWAFDAYVGYAPLQRTAVAAITNTGQSDATAIANGTWAVLFTAS